MNVTTPLRLSELIAELQKIQSETEGDPFVCYAEYSRVSGVRYIHKPIKDRLCTMTPAMGKVFGLHSPDNDDYFEGDIVTFETIDENELLFGDNKERTDEAKLAQCP